MRCFVDTSALYALLDKDDANQKAAGAAWQRLLAEDVTLVVTNYVLVETYALVQHRLGLAAVKALATEIAPVLAVEWVTPEDHRAATAALLVAARRDLSLVDCTSFEVMRRLGLRDAFTLDRHFEKQGFHIVA